MDGVADLLGARCGRTHQKFALKPTLRYHVPKYKLRHRAAAYVAVADKKYSCHEVCLLRDMNKLNRPKLIVSLGRFI